MSIVGGPPPSLARDVDVAPRTITAATIAVALASMVEPSQVHPLDILALGLSLQLSFRATWLATTRRTRWRSPPLPSGQALLRLAFLPVRPGVPANDAARRARHPRPEAWHRHGLRRPWTL